MHSLNTIFYFSFILHYAVMNFNDADKSDKSVVEFTFSAIPLGHSGILISWKPNISIQSGETSMKDYNFKFGVNALGENICNNNFEFNDHQSHNIEKEYEECEETIYNPCSSSQGQYKVHSLNESTLYEIIIQQYHNEVSSQQILRNYSVKMRTKLKSEDIPTKPCFEYIYPLQIKWYPCGKEEICHSDQESGTHFGITVREPYNTKRWIEVREEEFYSDFIQITFWPGRIYEVVVFSVNGKFETNSDTQEIFIQPAFTMVQDVNIISLPDSSVLISWKPPKKLQDAVVKSYTVFFSIYNKPDSDEEAPIFILRELFKSTEKLISTADADMYLQRRISPLKFGLTYNFIIMPSGDNQDGFEYRLRYKLLVHNTDFPIAQPDFRLKFVKTDDYSCQFRFQWLPCGQTFRCENTKPGSNYSCEFSPELPHGTDDTNGYCSGRLDLDTEYKVRFTSSIGKNFSEPVIKYFKNCAEIEKHSYEHSNEL